jgi:hypothetical protein
MSRSRTDAARPLAVAAVLAATLAGCSSADLYLDRRETMHLSAGDAIAANKVTHMVDPWPPASANKNIVFNGDKMQSAAERYRTGRIIQPKSPTTSDKGGAGGGGGGQQNGSGSGTP